MSGHVSVAPSLEGRLGTAPSLHDRLSGAIARLRKITFAVTIALFVAGLLLDLGWIVSGGHVLVVTTPSMSPRIPVGSLVATQPATFPLHLGEIVAVRPAMEHGTVYVHQIYAVLHEHGRTLYRTKGLLDSAADPWIIGRSNVVGSVAFSGAGLGYLLRCLPWLATLFVGFYVALRALRVIDAVAFLAAVNLAAFLTVVIVKPFVHVVVLSIVAHHGTTSAWLANTGVLDLRLHYDGVNRLLMAGHTAVVHAHGPAAGGSRVVGVLADPALRWWQWIVAIVLFVAPLAALLGLVFSSHGTAGEKEAQPAGSGGWLSRRVEAIPASLRGIWRSGPLVWQ